MFDVRQVLVWKTNFDPPPSAASKLCPRPKAERPRPHTHDCPKRSCVPNQVPACHFDAARSPANNVTPPPNVVNVAPRLFHRSDHGGFKGQTTPNGVPGSSTTPLEPVAMSPQLANTLEHIVGQLDILTQVYIIIVTMGHSNRYPHDIIVKDILRPSRRILCIQHPN